MFLITIKFNYEYFIKKPILQSLFLKIFDKNFIYYVSMKAIFQNDFNNL